MTAPRLGLVSYLNSEPIGYGLTHGRQRGLFEIVSGPPADLSDALAFDWSSTIEFGDDEGVTQGGPPPAAPTPSAPNSQKEVTLSTGIVSNSMARPGTTSTGGMSWAACA